MEDVYLTNGTILNGSKGKYSIVECITETRNARVYKAKDNKGNLYAIKHAYGLEKDKLKKYFEGEIEILKRISHPYIVNYQDAFKYNGVDILVMEYVDGDPMDDKNKVHVPMVEKQVIDFAIKICDVISYLHKINLIYRDLKPKNIILQKNNNIKLIDFNTAIDVRDSKRGETLILTDFFTAPEQISGERVDKRADIYAIGTTIYYFLTGKEKSGYSRSGWDPLELNSDISKELAEIVTKATKKEVEDRYQSISEISNAFKSLYSPPSLSLKEKLQQQSKQLHDKMLPHLKKLHDRLIVRPPKISVLYIDSEFISKKHAVINNKNGHWFVESVKNAKGGTYVNGKKIDKKYFFEEGDKISFANELIGTYIVKSIKDDGVILTRRYDLKEYKINGFTEIRKGDIAQYK